MAVRHVVPRGTYGQPTGSVSFRPTSWAADVEAFDRAVEPNVLGMATYAAAAVMRIKP